jgi:DNA ligase (NAD+)
MMTRIKELAELIRKHRQLYYNDTSEVEDDVFDAWVDELADLDPQHEVLQEVGAPVDSEHWEVVTHSIPMTSLDKVNTALELRAWLADRAASAYTVEEKLDGISISVEYRGGKLYRAVTRGGGQEGEDITRNVRKMKGIDLNPTGLTLVQMPNFTLRGEIMMLQEDFQAYNKVCVQKGWRSEPYKNARNGASGTARRLDGLGCEYLTVMFYEYFDSLPANAPRSDRMTYIQELGLKTPFFDCVDDYESIITVYEDYESKKRAELSYEIDGLVIKVNNPVEEERIETELQASTRKGKNPKSAVAWKFSAETRITTLEDIVWNLGKGGRVTPIGLLAPVAIGGVTVRRASLHNWDNVKELNLAPGCEVLIKRANDVIPQVVKRTDNRVDEMGFTPPTRCPGCNAQLQWDNKYLECVNPGCKALLKGTLRRWVEKVNVKFFGESVIEALVDDGKVKSIADLYKLSQQDIENSTSPGIASRAYKNLHANKQLELSVIIGSLGIKGFGRSLSRMLTEAGYDTVDKMLNITRSEIAVIDQFGEERADFIVDGLRRNESVVRELEGLVTIKASAVSTLSVGPLSGLSFCITGKLSQPKKVYETMIASAGGEYKTSVRRGLDYLIVADPSSGSAKLQKAEKNGIKIISEDEFTMMCQA